MSRSKKYILLTLLAFFVGGNFLAAAVLSPKPAQAQLSTADINFATFFGQMQVQKQMDEIDKNKNFMVMNAVINAMGYFANKIAYDMATWLASGAKGQGPFASTESFGSYLAQVAGDSLGEALGSLSESLGLNLCDLPDLRLDLMLQLGFHFAYAPPKPKCSWQQLKSAYSAENIRSKYGSMEGLSDRLSAGVAVSDSDFGVWFTAKERIDAHAREQTYGSEKQRDENAGFKGLTDLITGNIKTPAAVMKEEIIAQAPAKQNEKREAANSAQVWGAFGAGATQVAYQAASTFINTLLGTVLRNFMEQGMLPGGYRPCNPGLKITGVNLKECTSEETALGESYYSQGGVDNLRAAQEMYSELLTPKIKTLDNYNLVASLALCDESNHSPDTCVVDQSFLQILQSADNGEPLTIRQAMEKGWLHGDWLLISPSDLEQTDKWNCAEEAYCYRNLKFLRLARILPIGAEMAAYYASAETPESLQTAVDNFYNPDSVFYHLINPNWVIKLPKLRCKSYAYGAVAQDGVRLQECVDLQHCVGYNKDGSCQSWGYCMKERPIWKFTADYCDKQYNTCLAFSDTEGNQASYLLRTLDTVSCNAENDGCRRYSNTKFFSSTGTFWIWDYTNYHAPSETLLNTSNYFNKNISTCDVSSDGCSAFKLASDPETFVYLKKAPDYLECYDAGTTADTLSSFNEFCALFASNPLCFITDFIEFGAKLLNGVYLPQTVSELNSIISQSNDDCANYARVCIPEEENCNFFTSLLTGDVIPGKFMPAEVVDSQVIWNDQCASVCNGYAAYREMPSSYSVGQPISYIIPQSGKACSAAEEGCASFTNLNATQGGLEQNEYFSYLRLCMLPDQTKQKNFYVYESSEKGGYQLKTYTLEKNSLGGPKQIYRDPEEMAGYDFFDALSCSEASYNAHLADPDCHQFVDDQGTPYYAMLSKTVLVAEECTPYRLNYTELIEYGSEARCPYDFTLTEGDNRAGDSVEFRDNVCYYMGVKDSPVQGAGDTKLCSKETESCRAYKGNAGNNVREVFSDSFEGTTTTADIWSSSVSYITLALSTESTQLGGHSLRVTADTVGITDHSARRGNFQVQNSKSYVLSFWAKGTYAINHISLLGTGSETRFSDQVNPSDVWKYYTLGPIEYSGNDTTGTIAFFVGDTGGETKSIFIDNVRLVEVTDYVYLVKNSLSVDPVCDSNLNDNLPGEALGCSAYKDPANNTYYLTNFSYLCREEAIGCTALIDTFNTPDDPEARAYNVWIAARPGGGEEASVTIAGDVFSCQASTGESGCYANIFGKTIGQIEAMTCDPFIVVPFGVNPNCIKITPSTIYIPPDTSTSSPVYLVASKDATCKSQNMGCQAIGLETPQYNQGIAPLLAWDADYEDVAVLNDPASYDDTLCTAEAVGCKSWTSGDSNYYFKDPSVIGNTECVYKNETKGDTTYLGWYLKDHKRCMRNPAPLTAATASGALCSSDSECPEYYIAVDVTTTGKCEVVPCYPTYRVNQEYGLWSFGNSEQYLGLVGDCPAEQSGCTEFVDHSGEESRQCNLSSKKCEKDADCNEIEGDFCLSGESFSSYYLIQNDKLTQSENKCEGQVSQAEGCVLLDKTSLPNKYWNTSSTYALSISQDEGMVDPVDAGAQNDANTIMKVQHDRECAEWAYCDFQQTLTDPDTNETTAKCYHLGVCEEAALAVGTKRQCASSITYTWEGRGQELDTDYYKSMPRLWNSLELSGYSNPFDYQIPDLKVRQISSGVSVGHGTYYLVYVTTTPDCDIDTTYGTACGDSGGRCYNGECLLNISGDVSDTPTSSPTLACRSYPEVSSPFPKSILTEQTNWTSDGFLQYATYREGFDGANLCYNSSGKVTDACDCTYIKLKTGAGEVYSNDSAEYICVGGAKPGNSCNPVSLDENSQYKDCCILDTSDNCTGESGVCSAVKTLSIMSGWEGYCLEKDMRQRINGTGSHRCLIWYPLELPPGTTNIWLSDKQAGYEIGESKTRYMCMINHPIRKEGGQYHDSELIIASDFHNYTQDSEGDFDGVLGPSGDYLQVWSGDKVFTGGQNNAFTFWCVNNSDTEDSFVPGMDLTDGTDSKSYYCPLNADTAKSVGNPWETDWGTIYDIYPILNLPDNNPYIPKKYIERITIYFDGRSHAECDNGYVSFWPDITYEDPTFSWGFEYKLDGCSSEDMYYRRTVSDLGVESATLNDWYAWEWMGGSAALTQTCVDDQEMWSKSEPGVFNDIVNDVFSAHGMSNSGCADGNADGQGVRIVFDDLDRLRGIWYDGEDDEGGTAGLGFVAIITLRDGVCEKYLQVSTESSDYEFQFKPFAGRLVEEDLGWSSKSPHGDGYALSPERTKLTNWANYGLANASQGKGKYINPFIYPVGPDAAAIHTPEGYDATQEVSGFNAGVPLSIIRMDPRPSGALENWSEGYHHEKSQFNPFLVDTVDECTAYDITDDTSYSDDIYPPYCKMLNRMFARVYEDYESIFEPADGETEFDYENFVSYVDETGDDLSVTDVADPRNAAKAELNIYPPRIAAPVAGGTFVMDKISIDNETDANIYLSSGGTSFIQFYAWAHPNQMPLRRIAIDKGDGTEVTPIENDALGNKKYKCGDRLCADTDGEFWYLDETFLTSCTSDEDCGGYAFCSPDAYTGYRIFGSVVGKGCHEGPEEFVADYSCPGMYPENVVPWEGVPESEDFDSAHPINWNYIEQEYGAKSFVCVYRPRVQAMDNWGWCSGNCKSANLGGAYSQSVIRNNGCYQDWTRHDCELNKPNPWIYYGGNIIVVPND